MSRFRCPLAGLVALTAAMGLLGAACEEAKRPPTYQSDSRDASTADGGVAIPFNPDDPTAPPEDTTGLCGNQYIRPLSARPNLYFVIDRSGSMRDSMLDPATGVHAEKYLGIVGAIRDVLFAVGHRVAYGAAVFPRFGNVKDCNAGEQIFPVMDGDSVTWARSGQTGPHLATLIDTLNRFVPEGGTPISSTL